eukprot:56311-Pelagomonas_calceolata.AAC.1
MRIRRVGCHAPGRPDFSSPALWRLQEQPNQCRSWRILGHHDKYGPGTCPLASYLPEAPLQSPVSKLLN